MVFLKKFHAEGFKSFAHPITLNFNSTMIGIIGPNGSGKSNIVDALKWALGEQSIKSLRGKEKSNLIFAGSNDLKEADFALVELTFDNKSRILDYDSDEVKISRKLIRKTGENIYLLNDEPCLLKDIQTIFLDSGLAKGSLGIISQGSVNWFAEAKPEDRRQMFESAAGIGKYIKQKNEAIDRLEKATNNLERISTFTNALRKEVKELNKQAEKAQLYKEKKDQLKMYDVSVSVQDYLTYKDEVVELEKTVELEKVELEKLESNVVKSRELSEQFLNEYKEIDAKFTDLNNEKNELSSKINDLNVKQATFLTNLENKLSSGSIEERINSYQIIINSEKERYNSWKKQLEECEVQDSILQENERTIKEQLDLLNEQSRAINGELSKKRYYYEELKKQLDSSNSHERGVTELLKAKNKIGGIHTTIQNTIKVKERYEVAIQTALGKSMTNLIVDSDEIAVKAINYLKQNKCGRATFLPLNTIKGKEISPQTLTLIKNSPGFIDVANNLVECDPIYKNVISSILGNIAVADTIENANSISKIIRSTYKIISLDGDTVFAGGALAGGQSYQNRQVFFNLEEKVEKAQKEYEEILDEVTKLSINLEQVNHSYSQAQVKNKTNLQMLEKLKASITLSEQKIKQNEIELDALTLNLDTKQNEVQINKFEQELIELNEKLNKLDQELAETSELREISFDKSSKFNNELSAAQQEQNSLIKINSDHTSKLNNLKNSILNIENKLIDSYALTIDAAIESYNKPLDITINEAKRIIASLKVEIDALGNINFQALESLEEKEEELRVKEKETNDARESVDSLTNLINSFDKQAKENFVEVINKVNAIIPTVFKSLFGGGHCEIKIVDPQNILESGIDVIAQPPGKKVTNLVLFSGGEKTLIALAVLFALLKSSRFPLVLLDEAEAALDQANVNTFAKLIQEFSDACQFLVITHRTGTMKMCDVLYGTTMKVKGVTNVIKVDYNTINSKSTANTKE